MVNSQVPSVGFEWRVKNCGGSSEILVQETGFFRGIRFGLMVLVSGYVLKVRKFFEKAWNLGVDDPRKVIHCLKVGLALTVVSLFYYMRPLYDGVGGNAMWAIMTVVVVFEFTVGSTLYKCVNRIIGTSLAGALALGVYWIASHFEKKFEPIIVGVSLFLFTILATFLRFIPTIKARFDYGTMIFILTFSLVSVSSYRVDELFDLAQQRLSTIAIGTAFCLIVSICICPVWAGKDLHDLIVRNMEKLANSVDGAVAEYFTDESSNIQEQESIKNLGGYKCVLNSKATEESLANFARWEPGHGSFGFGHPWKQYLKIGTMMRSCVYCIEALNGCITSQNHTDESTKKNLSKVCMKLSSHSSRVLKELGIIINTTTRSSLIDFSVGEMNRAVEDLHTILKSLPTQVIINTTTPPLPVVEAHPDNNENQAGYFPAPVIATPLMEVLPLISLSSLLTEIASRIEKLVDAVDELSNLAYFKSANEEKPKHDNKFGGNPNDNDQSTKTLQMV